MRKLGEIVRRLFHPRPAAIAALVPVSAAGLAWCFLLGGGGTPISYAFYALSAYALAVVFLLVLAAAVALVAFASRRLRAARNGRN